MSVSVITVGGQSVNLVSIPTTPAVRTVEFRATDAVGIASMPYTGQVQAQQWPGADMLSGTFTLPVMQRKQAGPWLAWLLQCRGMANAFLIGDPVYATPLGTGGSMTVDNSGGGNIAGAQTLQVSGWSSGALLPGDYLQIGYRLHRVLDNANPIPIWPSLREVPANGAAVIVTNPVGLFRLAQNARTWSGDIPGVTKLSFQIQEYR